MGLSVRTNRMLWGRAASRCSCCRQDLVIDPLTTDDASLVGEVAHIVAEQPNGPRGLSDLTAAQRNKYDNLILLCNVHHQQVDDQEGYFTVQKLKELKLLHETWVRSRLDFDGKRQADDERWAGYIDEWVKKSRLDSWLAYTSGILTATPWVAAEFFEDLSLVRVWLLSRVWPTRYPDIRFALESFARIVNDASVAETLPLPRDRANARAQSFPPLVLPLPVALRGAPQPYQPAGAAFARPMLLPQLGDRRSLGLRLYHFFPTRSFSITKSIAWSATIRFSFRFSSSNCFSRCASLTSSPPYFAFQW